MKRILWDDRGYALVLTLLFMPVFVGLSLLIIDLNRANNAHSDLYAAADAVALAAGGELDGGSDAIDRAKAAMAVINDNSVSFLSLVDGEKSIPLRYVDEADNEFTVIFLEEIPQFDYQPIDQDWVNANATTSGLDAKYVYVSARSKDLDPIFPSPVSFEDADVPISAKAVAGRRIAVCEITPLFMCNPFETATDKDFGASFAAGKMHARLINLHNVGGSGGSNPGPGNYGFLDMGSGGSDLAKFMASPKTTACYSPDEVETEPGSKSIANGMNTRFDLYAGSYKNSSSDYPPAKNVRKGYWDPSGNTSCGVEFYDEASPPSPPPYLGFPDNAFPAGNPEINPQQIGSGTWDYDQYFEVNHGIDLDSAGGALVLAELAAIRAARFPNGITSPGEDIPSRYDVYLWELAADERLDDPSPGIPDPDDPTEYLNEPETSNPMCAGKAVASPDPLRRIVQVAVVNCLEALENDSTAFSGKSDILKVEAYASFFLTNPMEGANGDIRGELIDSTGAGFGSTLDSFIRVESVLVR